MDAEQRVECDDLTGGLRPPSRAVRKDDPHLTDKMTAPPPPPLPRSAVHRSKYRQCSWGRTVTVKTEWPGVSWCPSWEWTAEDGPFPFASPPIAVSFQSVNQTPFSDLMRSTRLPSIHKHNSSCCTLQACW